MRFLKGLRFHLSTALVCMIVAGGLIGLNATKRTFYTFEYPTLANRHQQFGWPYVFCETDSLWQIDNWIRKENKWLESEYWRWHRAALCFDIAMLSVILLIVVLASEGFIRRRKTLNLEP